MIPKYRAWIKSEKRMVATDNLLCIDYENEEIVTQEIYFESGLPSERDIDNYDFDDINLMQSTGLKDKNGKEIFEGDIVTDGDVTSDIKYHQTLGFYMIGKYGFSVPFGQGVDVEYFEEFADHVSKTFEVAGNVYENPELLEVTE